MGNIYSFLNRNDNSGTYQSCSVLFLPFSDILSVFWEFSDIPQSVNIIRIPKNEGRAVRFGRYYRVLAQHVLC